MSFHDELLNLTKVSFTDVRFDYIQYWRGSQYLGCASAKKDGCERHICHYYPAGNCAMGNESKTAENWKTPVLKDYSDCGGPKRCPDDGCYIDNDAESIR